MSYILKLTEGCLLAYWIFAALDAFGVIALDPALMYSDYLNPTVVAWNWSFFPLDLIFITIGLCGMQRLKQVELTLMFCAGLMAISFWVFQNSFDPLWWGMNIWLMVISSIGLYQDIRNKG